MFCIILIVVYSVVQVYKCENDKQYTLCTNQYSFKACDYTKQQLQHVEQQLTTLTLTRNTNKPEHIVAHSRHSKHTAAALHLSLYQDVPVFAKRRIRLKMQRSRYRRTLHGIS